MADGPEERTVHGPADTSESDRAQALPRGYRVGDWEVTGPIADGGWATVYAGRPVRDGDSDSGGDPGPGPGPGRDPGVGVGVGFGGTDGARPDGVALKFLSTAGLSPRQARKVAETARREVELGTRSPHPRLIRLLGSLVLSDPDHPFLDGAIVLVMERARCSLRDLLGAPPDEAGAARLIAEVCEGLAHLHRVGWVHGDLKPDNVLIMEDGSARLADFGIATELTGTRGTHGYAPPMGTFDYLPPERWKAPLGEHGVEVRPSADIWALGVMVHELFASGAPPFPGATPMARGAVAQEYADGRAPLRLDPRLPPFWRELVTDCLAPTHAERAAHTAESLYERVTARTSALGSATRPRPRRPGRVLLLGSLALCAAAAATAAACWSYAGREDGAREEAEDRIRVFNAEQSCRARTDRDVQCSLGLAIDPLKAYTADNVVTVRVWHGDVLAVDCQLPGGMPIIDEMGTRSTQWFHVRFPPGSPRNDAWLPAVRTKDRPALPPCPRPAPAG
ncbi:serine/threonine-protein kinase [Streptomyces sp. G-G2]|uniref:serine/threonine-protein kinase n=1 Tax=Streptomyces sp. G-G2 TaxID=3046201 RepID=UPI0024BB6A41|nr:serine/threonine-protein kinase [Streptomyces sp. G-G2]MDJ0381113.1 serine/threonine-protein kinase [Streptomyces sp. G-G2]